MLYYISYIYYIKLYAIPVSVFDFLSRKQNLDNRKPKPIKNLRQLRHFSLKVLKYYCKHNSLKKSLTFV